MEARLAAAKNHPTSDLEITVWKIEEIVEVVEAAAIAIMAAAEVCRPISTFCKEDI